MDSSGVWFQWSYKTAESAGNNNLLHLLIVTVIITAVSNPWNILPNFVDQFVKFHSTLQETV